MFENLKSDCKVFLEFWSKEQYLTYLSVRNRLEIEHDYKLFYKYVRNRYLGNRFNNFMWGIHINNFSNDINFNQRT